MEKYNRGQHPNSRANLVGNQSPFTSENGRERQAIGVESRRNNKTCRELLEKALAKEITNKYGETATKKEATFIMLANEMAKGNLKAINLGMKILGELKEKIELDVDGKISVLSDDILLSEQ